MDSHCFPNLCLCRVHAEAVVWFGACSVFGHHRWKSVRTPEQQPSADSRYDATMSHTSEVSASSLLMVGLCIGSDVRFLGLAQETWSTDVFIYNRSTMAEVVRCSTLSFYIVSITVLSVILVILLTRTKTKIESNNKIKIKTFIKPKLKLSIWN